jgi:hypothetical protein
LTIRTDTSFTPAPLRDRSFYLSIYLSEHHAGMGNGTHNLLIGGHEGMGPWCLWRFHFKNELVVSCLFIKWKCTYLLDFEPWRWSALNMGFRGQVAFKNARAILFEVGWDAQNISIGIKKSWFFLGGCPEIVAPGLGPYPRPIESA